MRLLKCVNNTGEVSLTNDLVSDDVILRYAQCTRGADPEEVSFKGMIDSTGTSKPGYV